MSNALEIHAHYSKLFEAFAMLPLDDIGGELFEQVWTLWAESSWSEFGKFIERIESYLQQSTLTAGRREKIKAFLIKQKPHYEKGLWLVEIRPRVIELDEPDLKRRLNDVKHGRIYTEFESIRRSDGPETIAEHFTKVRMEVERRLGILAGRRTVKQACVLLQATGTDEIREFTPEHAERLLAYPGTLWEKAPAGAVPTEPAPTIDGSQAGQPICPCHLTGDVEQVEDLSADCTIVAMLNDPQATAHVRAEMSTFKELKLPKQYQRYCIERLEHHAALAARFANEMNKPGGWSHTKMGLKFYNAAISKLYRAELVPHQLATAPKENTIVEAFRQYLPGFLAGRANTDKANAELLTDWAFEVRGWGNKGSALWLQQQNYERLLGKYHAPGRFLDGLEHLLTLLEPSLLSDAKAKELFGHVRDVATLTRIVRRQAEQAVEQAGDPYVDVEKVRRETSAGVASLRKWIEHRRLPAHLQLLDMLRTVQFVESDEPDEHGLAQLTVPFLSEKDFQECFAIIRRRFEAELLNTGILTSLLRQLRGLMNLPFQRMRNHEQESKTGAFHLANLPARYRNWDFPGLADRHVTHSHSLTPRLWQEVVWAFYQRIKGAWQLHNIIAGLLGKPSAADPLPQEAPGTGDMLYDDIRAMEELQAYLIRLPVFLNSTHQFDLPVECGGYDDQDEEFRPLLRAFSTALLRNPPKKSQRRQLLGELLNIVNISDGSVKKKREAFEAGNYSLSFLAADYPMFRFGEIEAATAAQAAPLFWSFFTAWVNYRKLFAREAYNLIADSLGKPRLALTGPSDAPTVAHPKRTASPRGKTVVKLLPGIGLEDVRTLLTEAGMGTTYLKPGEWAAAFRALSVETVLQGLAPAVTRWACEQGYVEELAGETIKKAWQEEKSDARQFNNLAQKTVFRNVSVAARNMLATKGIKSVNK